MSETVSCFDLNELLQLSPFAEVSLYELTSDSLFADIDRRIDSIRALRGHHFFGKDLRAAFNLNKGLYLIFDLGGPVMAYVGDVPKEYLGKRANWFART